MLTTEQIRVLNEARTILKRIEADCGSLRRHVPDSWTEADGHDYGRIAEAATTAEWQTFGVLNIINSSGAQTVSADLLHNREEDPVRGHGRVTVTRVYSDEDGFHLEVMAGEQNLSHDFAIGDGPAPLHAVGEIRDHWADGERAAAEHQRDLDAADGDGYALDDPKHPTYHDRVSDLADRRAD